MVEKKQQSLFIFCDGGARGNPGPAGIGFLIKDSQGRILTEKKEFIGRATNNVAEYQAVIKALETIVQFFPQPAFLNFYLDSQLVVNQLSGKFKIKNSGLMALVIKIKNLEKKVKGLVFYHHIPREKNKQADSLVNQALDQALKLK